MTEPVRKTTQHPVYLATLRESDDRDTTNGCKRPYAIQGHVKDSMVWYITREQAERLFVAASTLPEPADDGVNVVLHAEDWYKELMPEWFKRRWPKPMNTVDISINVDASQAIAKINDARKLAEEIGRQIVDTGMFPDAIKEPPIPTPINQPDPHAECRIHLVGGKLVDDYGRSLAGVSTWEASVPYNCAKMRYEAVKLTLPVVHDPPDGSRPPATQPEPLVFRLDRKIPPDELKRISDEIQRVGRSAIFLPQHIHRAEPPEEERVRADVAHRVDLAAASRTGWRWGLAAGAVAALVLSCVALFAVAHVKPEWLAKLAPRAESRAPLSTPWSPAALDSHDEHARESEQAKQDARDAEGR